MILFFNLQRIDLSGIICCSAHTCFMDISYFLKLLEAFVGFGDPKKPSLRSKTCQVLPDGGWIDWPRFPSTGVVHYSLCPKMIFHVSNLGEIKVCYPLTK